MMDLKKFIPEINPNRNYWLVRTQGGMFFQEFFFSDYIAIDWNEIDDVDLIKDEKRHNELVELIKEKYDKDSVPGLSANQMRKFVRDMKKGDVVIIPSKNSEYIAYGELLNDEIYIENVKEEELEKDDCNFRKRRAVRWIKHQKKEEIDVYMYKLLNNHQTISSANEFADIIDRTLQPFYIKDDKAHFIVKVNQEGDISAIDLSSFVYNTTSLVDSFNKISNEQFNKREINTKVNVHSPGIIEFIGPIKVMSCIAFGAVILLGGETSFFGIKIKTDGLSKNILEWVKALNEMKKSKENLSEREKEILIASEQLKVTIPYAEQLESIAQNVIEEETEDKK